MTFIALHHSTWWTWPFEPLQIGRPHRGSSATASSLNDAVGEKQEQQGRIRWSDGATHTFSSAGGKIHFMPGAITWANGATNVRVGIQDLKTGTTSVTFNYEADGTFDVYGDLVPGVDSLTAGSWTSKAMSSGSKSIADGDRLAIVFEMTARGGTDAFRCSHWTEAPLAYRSTFRNYTTVYATPTNTPSIWLEADDGTIGTFEGTWPAGQYTENYSDASNPDERGLIFQIPFRCKIDAICPGFSIANTYSETLSLYSDPLGTPTTMTSRTIGGAELMQLQSNGLGNWLEITEQTLEADTDYWVAMRGPSGANVTMAGLLFTNAAYRAFLPGGTTLRKGTRNNNTGAATEDTTRVPQIAVRISAIEFSTGGSSGTPSFGLGGGVGPRFRGLAS